MAPKSVEKHLDQFVQIFKHFELPLIALLYSSNFNRTFFSKAITPEL